MKNPISGGKMPGDHRRGTLKTYIALNTILFVAAYLLASFYCVSFDFRAWGIKVREIVVIIHIYAQVVAVPMAFSLSKRGA